MKNLIAIHPIFVDISSKAKVVDQLTDPHCYPEPQYAGFAKKKNKNKNKKNKTKHSLLNPPCLMKMHPLVAVCAWVFLRRRQLDLTRMGPFITNKKDRILTFV